MLTKAEAIHTEMKECRCSGDIILKKSDSDPKQLSSGLTKYVMIDSKEMSMYSYFNHYYNSPNQKQ